MRRRRKLLGPAIRLSCTEGPSCWSKLCEISNSFQILWEWNHVPFQESEILLFLYSIVWHSKWGHPEWYRICYFQTINVWNNPGVGGRGPKDRGERHQGAHEALVIQVQDARAGGWVCNSDERESPPEGEDENKDKVEHIDDDTNTEA